MEYLVMIERIFKDLTTRMQEAGRKEKVVSACWMKITLFSQIQS
jgi:hypothetical protein